MPDRNDARDMLRREGLTSYFDALMAVDEFTRLIQEDCRKVLERHAAALHDATGLKFAAKEISDYSEPYNGKGKVWSGQYASIGSILRYLSQRNFTLWTPDLPGIATMARRLHIFIPVFTRRTYLFWII